MKNLTGFSVPDSPLPSTLKTPDFKTLKQDLSRDGKFHLYTLAQFAQQSVRPTQQQLAIDLCVHILQANVLGNNATKLFVCRLVGESIKHGLIESRYLAPSHEPFLHHVQKTLCFGNPDGLLQLSQQDGTTLLYQAMASQFEQETPTERQLKELIRFISVGDAQPDNLYKFAAGCAVNVLFQTMQKGPYICRAYSTLGLILKQTFERVSTQA